MANRQDSGSNSSHENQRPDSHNEDRLPENTDHVRDLGGDEAGDFDEDEEEELEMDEEDEGSK